jgi:hypothetical protein
MTFDNSVYTITPPSLYLNENGPSIMLLGYEKDRIAEICQIFDKFFPENSICYYYDTKPISEKTTAWALATLKFVDWLVVNADNLNITETYIASTLSTSINDKDPLVLWIAEERKNSSLCKLLLRDKQKIYTHLEELDQVLSSQLDIN